MKKLLPIRICSPEKANIDRGYLWQIYTTPMLQVLFAATRNQAAILSRKYGISLPDKIHDRYTDSEQLSDKELFALLVAQAPEFKDTILLYWNHRPLTHDKWVKMLRDAGFHVEEYRTIAQLMERFRGVPDHVVSVLELPRDISNLVVKITKRKYGESDYYPVLNYNLFKKKDKYPLGFAILAINFDGFAKRKGHAYLAYIEILTERRKHYGTFLLKRIIRDVDRKNLICHLTAVDSKIDLLKRKVKWYSEFGFEITNAEYDNKWVDMVRPSMRRIE